jgi:uncharacterized membrane protein
LKLPRFLIFLLPLLGASTLCSIGAALAQPSTDEYFTGIGTLSPSPGNSGPNSFAYAVSADGNVVVGESYRRYLVDGRYSSTFEAIRWTLEGGIEGLGGLREIDPESSAHDVSADGSVIVGTSFVGEGSDRSPFQWTPEAGMESLSLPLGARALRRLEVSGDGSLVGGSLRFPAYSVLAIWPPDRDFRYISIPLSDAAIGGISGDGSVLAVFVPRLGAALYRDDRPAGERYSALPRLPDTRNESPIGISSSGKIAVGSVYSLDGRYPAMWSQGTAMLLREEPDSRTRAQAVSRDGAVVVGKWGIEKSFVWTYGDGFLDLRTHLIGLGFDLSDWLLLEATDISDDGRTIVGNGRTSRRAVEGWVVRLPPACSDGLDNDADGERDSDDSDCLSPSGADEGSQTLDLDDDGVPFYLDSCADSWNPDQTDTDGDSLGDACDRFPENPVNEFGQCLLDVGECRQDLFLCTVDQEVCTGNLETCRADLISTGNDLAQALADLQACLLAPPPDADGDGETDATDACADTPPGVEVDHAGCSQAQFCGAIAIQRTAGRATCLVSDWKNDHPVGRPGDCTVRPRSWVSSETPRCRSAAR